MGKDDKPVTRNELFEVLGEFWEKTAFPAVENVVDEKLEPIRTKLEKVADKVERVEVEVKHIRRELKDMDADTVSRKEHEGLKKRIERLELHHRH